MMQRHFRIILLLVLLLLGCGETPTEPEPDRPERDPEPEVVIYREAQAAPSTRSTYLLPYGEADRCGKADSLVVQEARTSSENACK